MEVLVMEVQGSEKKFWKKIENPLKNGLVRQTIQSVSGGIQA